MPYGEFWKNQQRTPYNERFKFTGKERDEESGYDYFGARNYTSAASIWLSPDPLLDKHPNGDMLPLGSKDGKYHPLSTGCLIIALSRKGKTGWNEFNNQLQGIKKAFLKLKRQ